MKFNCIFHVTEINVFGQKRQNVNINVNLRFFSLIVVNSAPFSHLFFPRINAFIYVLFTLSLTFFDVFIYVNIDGFLHSKTNKL